MQIGTYEAAQREKARALKRKFYPQSPKPIFKPAVYEIPAFMHLIPSWKKESSFFDHHVTRWRRMIQEENVNPIKAYIVRRAAQLGLTYEELTTRPSTRKVSHCRFLIMWEIKNHVKPLASYPEIAKAFGGFDHTSVMHAIKRVDEWKRDMRK